MSKTLSKKLKSTDYGYYGAIAVIGAVDFSPEMTVPNLGNAPNQFKDDLKTLADDYYRSLENVYREYTGCTTRVSNILNGETDWECFHPYQKEETKKLISLARLLFEMCSVPLLKPSPNQWEVEDGKSYYISPMCAPDNVLDVDAQSRLNGASIQSYQNKHNPNQRFITEAHGEYFVLRDENSQKVIDVHMLLTENDRKIQIFDYTNNNAHLWRLIQVEDGYFTICSKLNENFCIDIPYATKEKTPVHLWERNGSPAQKFRFTPADYEHTTFDGFIINESAVRAMQKKADDFLNQLAKK